MNNWHWEIDKGDAMYPPTVTSFIDGWRPWYGVMRDGPSVMAEVFTREFVQNFADAGDELKADLGHDATPNVEFRFVRLSGEPASSLMAVLGIESHLKRYEDLSDAERNDHRLGGSNLLEGHSGELSLLVAQERYATGMYGPWSTDGYAELEDGTKIRRKMRDALIKPSGSKSTSTALGSYGEGKRGVILSSRLRTLLAYTCFLPRPGEPEAEVTRRLLGVTYWRKHVRDRMEHTGLALLGAEGGTRPQPFEDEEADDVIESLDIEGVTVRDPRVPRDLGTTWVFVEPAFDAAELAWAIERNWWPRLESGTLEARVIDEDHTEVPVEPRARPQLRPFLQANDLLEERETPRENLDRLAEVQMPGVAGGKVGTIALTVDLEETGWSWDDPDRNAQMAAIVRGGMVIQYETFPRSRPNKIGPYTRSVFVVEGDDAGSLLRSAEPPLHNYWETDPRSPFPADSVDLARKTYNKLNDEVREFAKRFREEKKGQEFQFDTFANFFRVGNKPIVDPKSKSKEKSTTDPWHILRPHPEELEAHPKDPSLIRVRATRTLQLKDEWRDEELAVSVRIGWRVLEDDDTGVAAPELAIPDADEFPDEFDEDGGVYQGVISKTPVEFSWTSEYYEADWLTKASFEVESIQNEESDG